MAFACAVQARANTSLGVSSAEARAATDRILAAPEFNRGADQQSGWGQWLWDHILAALSGLRDWLHNLPGWLFYIIVFWLVLALLAILGHLLYVVWTQFGRGSRSRPGAPIGVARAMYGTPDLDFDTAHARGEAARRAGDWPGAIGWYYVAALLWLDRQNLVQFAQSKTNHDYARELATGGALRQQFEQMTTEFENVAYGGRPASETVCGAVAGILETMQREVDARKPA